MKVEDNKDEDSEYSDSTEEGEDVFHFILFSYLKNFTIITLYNVCGVPWGCSVPWKIHDTCGDILSTVEDVRYRGDIMIHVGDTMSTGGVQYRGVLEWQKIFPLRY